ncbi:MAG: prepilin-type N-terminal cleavage/methylation domain-containing protein [Bacteriovoracaceae bacterium]
MDRKVTFLSERGFSLLEVMIAFVLFTLFVTAFLTSTGYNVSDSTKNEEQLLLETLCERKLNQIMLDPPKFQNITSSGLKETKKFEESALSNYEYTLEVKKLMMPDFTQMFAQKGGTNQAADDAYEGNYFGNGGGAKKGGNGALEKMVFEELRKNIEKIIWQARVTVTNRETKASWSLSTYLTNYNEKVQINVGF